jgi:hypothetical protein
MLCCVSAFGPVFGQSFVCFAVWWAAWASEQTPLFVRGGPRFVLNVKNHINIPRTPFDGPFVGFEALTFPESVKMGQLGLSGCCRGESNGMLLPLPASRAVDHSPSSMSRSNGIGWTPSI